MKILKKSSVNVKFAKIYAHTKSPPKSVLPISVTQPFQVWALDVVGPMPGNGPKKYIVTSIDYATRWPVAQATKEHKGNDIRRFIGKEIIAKFGPPRC